MSSVNLAVISFAVRVLHRFQIKETFFEIFIFSIIWCILSLFLLFFGVLYFKKPPLIDSLNLKTLGNE